MFMKLITGPNQFQQPHQQQQQQQQQQQYLLQQQQQQQYLLQQQQHFQVSHFNSLPSIKLFLQKASSSIEVENLAINLAPRHSA